MSAPAGNGASGASGTGPTSGYNLLLLYFIGFIVKFELTLNTCTCLVSLTIVMKLLINCMCNFRIKMCLKMLNYLTASTLNFAKPGCLTT
jgi:hypothetical protein